MGKILANLANGVQFAKFFLANSYKYSEITEDLPAGSPKFSSPFASSVMIRQNFLPPIFSHVRYLQEQKLDIMIRISRVGNHYFVIKQ